MMLEIALHNGVIDRMNGRGKYAFLDEELKQREDGFGEKERPEVES